MIQLNAAGRDAMVEVGVNSATDVTGFGLAGHTYEMAAGSGVTIVLHLSRLPLLPGVERFARKPYLTRASGTNATYVGPHLRKEGRLDPTRLEFLFDPQTSGGLLISVPANRAEALVARCKEKGTICAEIIGEVIERTDAALIVRQ
jgi:selenide,water dikinase